MITVHNADYQTKTCVVAHHKANVIELYYHLSWKLAGKLQERVRSEEERKLLKPFGFMEGTK